MDDAGLFFPLSSSGYVFKLSEAKKKEDRDKLDCRVFDQGSMKLNGGTITHKPTSTTIQTEDTLGSKDLLVLHWYMDLAGLVYEKSWSTGNLPRYKKQKRNDGKNVHTVPVDANQADLPTPASCKLVHDRVLEVTNDIRTRLVGKEDRQSRLPKGGAGGLVFFLCRSRSNLPSGPYRKFCNLVIHHFDPDDDSVDQISSQLSSLTVNDSKANQLVSKTKKSLVTDNQPPNTHKHHSNDQNSTNKKQNHVPEPKTQKLQPKQQSKTHETPGSTKDNPIQLDQPTTSNKKPISTNPHPKPLKDHSSQSTSQPIKSQQAPDPQKSGNKQNDDRVVYVRPTAAINSKEELKAYFESKGQQVERVFWKPGQFAFVTFNSVQTTQHVLNHPKQFPALIKISTYRPNKQ